MGEISINDFDKNIGHLAETNQNVGDLSKGHQVILLKKLDNTKDPLILCESRGRFACVHLSEIEIFETVFEIK